MREVKFIEKDVMVDNLKKHQRWVMGLTYPNNMILTCDLLTNPSCNLYNFPRYEGMNDQATAISKYGRTKDNYTHHTSVREVKLWLGLSLSRKSNVQNGKSIRRMGRPMDPADEV